MKKLLTILVSLCLLLTLASCAGNKPANTDATTDPATSAAEGTAEPSAENESTTAAGPNASDAATTNAEPVNGTSQNTEAQSGESQNAATERTESQSSEKPTGEPQSSGKQDEETQSEMATPTETATAENRLQAKITLTWMGDYKGDLDSMDYCVAVDHAQTGFVITTDRTVKDLQILLLQDADFWDDGHISFKHSVVHSQAALTPDAPLLVHTTFFGDMPNVGVSYTDADGARQTYAVDVSGMDGHLYLMGFVDGGAK